MSQEDIGGRTTGRHARDTGWATLPTREAIMPELQHPPSGLTLYTCHVDRGGPAFLPHACRRAHEVLDEADVAYEGVIFGKGRPFALGTYGNRPELKRISGQEMLPVLAIPDGPTM